MPSGNTSQSFEISSLNKYIKYINFIIIYIVTFTLVCIPKYEIVGMGLLLSFNFIIQSFLVYDIVSLKDIHNFTFNAVIAFGIMSTFISSFYILKLLVHTQNKNREVGHITQLIDKNTNHKYHLFSNLFMTNVGLIFINAILYFIYRNTNNSKYANNYLYNELDYKYIDYSFFENIFYRTSEFCESTGYLLYPFIFLAILAWNISIAISINTAKTIVGLFNNSLQTSMFLCKSTSLFLILVISCIIFYLSTTLARVRFKKINNNSSESTSNNIDSAKNNSVFSKIGDIFQNLNMNYLLNYKVVS
jgi:hypothetical protein